MFGVAAILSWPLLLALFAPLAHDESQYVSATYFAARGLLPYRDFAYLQTPLQPFVLAPLQWLFPGWLLLASRLASSLFAVLTLVFVALATRQAGATMRAAVAAALLLLCCYSFEWAAGLSRNDMLAAALLAAALWLLMSSDRALVPVAAGLCIGFATSTKISYAFSALGVALALLASARKRGVRETMCFSGGLAVGLLPMLIFAAAAPSAFLFEAITFPEKAPLLWYREIGAARELGIFRFAWLLFIAALGPALSAGGLLFYRAAIDSEVHTSRRQSILLWAVIGGLVGAGLNRPFNPPYLVPVLPPLFVWTGLYLSDRWTNPATRRFWSFLSLIGLVVPTAWLVKSITAVRMEPLADEVVAHKIGRTLAAQGAAGEVAGLRNEWLVDTGYAPDPRFAAGPFLFRTRGFVSARDAVAWHIVARDQADILAHDPPAAFVTGGVSRKKMKVEDDLTKEIVRLRFVPVARVERFTIWMRLGSCRRVIKAAHQAC